VLWFLLPRLTAEGVVRWSLEWIPQAGLAFELRLDGLAWLFALAITGIGALVVLYARYYMSPADPVPRFFSFLLAFMGSMLGIVVSGNLLQLVIFWELTSFASFVLIGYWYHRRDARRGARMALGITAAGGLCLLAAVLMLGQIVGSYRLDEVLAAGDLVRSHEWYTAVLVLLLAGAFTKSAQFPTHVWLPHAMAAPTPVSAYLHSATMVKAGVFLLARLWPVMSGTEQWFQIVSGIGLTTFIFGAHAAIYQRDMKGVLAYSTISHLGLITLLLGMNSRVALVAAVFHMMNHATFKASLFMAAGIVDHEAGTRDLNRLGGLHRLMPLTATLAVVAAAAMAGVPLLNGFLSKEMFFAEVVAADESRGLLPILATIGGVFSVAYSMRFLHKVFFGVRAPDTPRVPHDPARWMLVPSALLVIACLLVGILPGRTVGPLLEIAVRSILGADTPEYSLAAWHGLTEPLLMSIAALSGGVLLYALLHRIGADSRGRAPLIDRIDGRRAFDILNIAVVRIAGRIVSLTSSRRLQPQLAIIVVLVLGAAYLAMEGSWSAVMAAPRTPLDPLFALLWVVGAVCTVGVAWQARFHRLAALIMLGGTGLVTALTFAWFSAPDLALTQLSVEVVTLVLLLLGLRWLPKRVAMVTPWRQTLQAGARRSRDLLLALTAGAGVGSLVYVLLNRPAPSGIAPFFIERALADGRGANVVNVMLVDFRGFDTLGEMTVLCAVALAVFKLLRRFRPAPESVSLPVQAEPDPPPVAGTTLPAGIMLVPTVLGRMLLPVAGMVSVFFLLRGHDAPGGGFVGGLVMATGFIVQYLVNGAFWVESRLRIRPTYWIASGLLLAVATGAGPWIAGRVFLTSRTIDVELPLIGPLHLSSTLLFDIGVYLLVVGATILMLVALAHQSLRSHRVAAGPEVTTGVRVFG
jgi:multicomponent K+:H+ antiporter subunit A